MCNRIPMHNRNMEIPDNLNQIASIIQEDWKTVYFGAVPYLNAMFSLNTMADYYGYDSGESIVRYFLGNAQTWRGQTARAVKAKLNQLLKGQ